jgi:hypothetical protein
MIFRSPRFPKVKGVSVAIPAAALEAVFDECDRYDADETGGRILGTYDLAGGRLDISVTGIIEPGPAARRTATYFKQDGEHQEKVFRQVEAAHPSIEHLGNWHTHHVNGLRHLSGGDIETYLRTVNHEYHNTDFFYALLVTEKVARGTGLERYLVKHYLLRRGDPRAYEIPSSAIQVVKRDLVWPMKAAPEEPREPAGSTNESAATRLYDSDAVARFFPLVKPFMSKELGLLWRGPLQLVDGSDVEVVVVEQAVEDRSTYIATIRKPKEELASVTAVLGESVFDSCREALISTERMCNSALFQAVQTR